MSKKPARRNNGYAGSVASSATGSQSNASAYSTPATPLTPDQSEHRKRQTKRDEQIRKKLENEISKRRNNNTPFNNTITSTNSAKPKRRPPPGTVLSLRPSPPLTMKLNTTIYEAAQFMSAKRENCVLVLDDDESICGIFTAKDLAFKIVGSGLDARNLTIESIMTKNPLCARTDTSATDALNLMVSKGFRHLPVMDHDQNIAGVLDITKCFYEAMQKLERAYESSRKLYDALEGVQSELGSSQPAQIIDYVEALRQQTEGPDLGSVLIGDSHSTTVFVDVRTSVSDAAALMKENHTTAVLVTDQDNITGIFTSKDVVLRVIAAGLDPKNCSVVRVMTPQPDFAPATMSIQQALRKMHDGHYLNLPVMGQENQIVGIVDVLKLTYATLEQIDSMGSGNEDGSNTGPAWNKFWMSLDNDTESVHSDGNNSSVYRNTPSRSNVRDSLDGDVSAAELAQFNIGSGEIEPSESISRQGHHLQQPVYESPSVVLNSTPFPFKFKSPAGRVHRVTAIVDNGINMLRQAIIEKLALPELESLGGAGTMEEDKMTSVGFAVSYVDDEGDAVAITSNQDLADAINISRSCGLDKADLYLHHPDQPAPIESSSMEKKKPEKKQNEQEKLVKSKIQDEYIPGVPNELILPGAIVTLAVSIILVFTFTRNSR